MGCHWNFIYSFWGLLLGSADVEKWGDLLEKKFIVDNVIQALIPFKKGHWGLSKLYVHLGERISVWEKKDYL